MTTYIIRVSVAVAMVVSPVLAQRTNDPFPEPIEALEGVIEVDFVEFASIPDLAGEAARPMILIDEPGTARFFVNDMRGPLYSVSYDGDTVTEYVDTHADNWGFSVESTGRERGMQSFAFHPQFGQAGAPGVGKFYTWSDVTNTEPAPDFVPGGGQNTHDTVLLEWRARTPGATTYDGGAPRELFRFEQPFRNHNGGQIGFNPLAAPGDADFGLLYVGVADGGSGGDPLFNSQKLNSGFGKIFRIDPLGSNSANGQYGIPAENPFNDGDDATLSEIYAYGVRNPQNFAWGPSERKHVLYRHRPEYRRGNQPGDRGGESRMEHLGRELWFHQPPGGEPRGPAERSPRDLSDCGVRAAGSAPPASICVDRPDRLPSEHDSSTTEPHPFR